MATPPNLDHLQQIHELNRAFLGLLQTRVRADRPCFGLPPSARPAVAGAGQDWLDALAGFPRALFEVQTGPRPWPNRPALGAYFDQAEHDLCLSILFAARHTSRVSPYQARLLFGLETREVDRLGALPLTDLQRLARQPGALQCALRERHWFWAGLITATRPELRRQLTLMALQPGIALEWPQRRPPHASA
jgi:hypothetical protein